MIRVEICKKTLQAFYLWDAKKSGINDQMETVVDDYPELIVEFQAVTVTNGWAALCTISQEVSDEDSI